MVLCISVDGVDDAESARLGDMRGWVVNHVIRALSRNLITPKLEGRYIRPSVRIRNNETNH